MAGSIEFTPPYQDGWQDNEEGATPITADILNNNYDAFLLLLNTWIGNIEEELVAVPDFQISSPSSGQVLKYDGSKWVNAAESGGGSNVSWNQVLQSGTQIASITINGTSYTVYAPTPITNLNGLSDVTLASPSNGQVLQFNSNTSKWENKSISVGDSVEFTQVLSSGVKIGTITIDGTDYDIYAPQGGGGSYEPNGVTYTIVNNSTDETQSGQTARSIVVNKFEDDVQTDTGSLSYATVVTTGPNNFTVGNVKTTYTLVSGTAYWVLTVVSCHIQYNGTLYETGDEILRTPVVGSSVITLTDIEEMEESHSTVVWTQTQQSGTKIAEISIDGVSQNVYIPTLPTKTSDLTNDSNFVADASYVHTDNNYTTPEKNKLAGLNQVEANPSSGTSAGNLNSIEIGGTKYDIPSGGGGGTTVIANPSGTPTDELNSIQIGNDIYEIPSGGGGTAEWTDVIGTLEAGDTEIVLTSSKIKTDSAVFPWTNKFGVAPTNMVVTNGSATLTFPVQSTDLDVMVRVSKVNTGHVYDISLASLIEDTIWFAYDDGRTYVHVQDLLGSGLRIYGGESDSSWTTSGTICIDTTKLSVVIPSTLTGIKIHFDHFELYDYAGIRIFNSDTRYSGGQSGRDSMLKEQGAYQVESSVTVDANGYIEFPVTYQEIASRRYIYIMVMTGMIHGNSSNYSNNLNGSFDVTMDGIDFVTGGN